MHSQIPKRLIARVDFLQKSGESPPSFTPASMTYPSSSSQPVAGLVYGVPVGSYYQLYYFFPLTQVQQSLVLIQRTLLVAGLALVFLFAAIAWLVTRWVVAPVRQAARGAQRLSTGNLDERMQVRGADELAALATSFNDMAASLQEKMSALEDLSHVQRQFVSDVSHELRTPLTTIRIAADVLFASREQLEGPASRSAELLQSQLERFESLLTDLLEISRYDANVAVLDPEPVDVCDLVRHSADVAQQLAERRGAKIEFRLPAEPCVADVDRRRVERILRNLLVNAVEHGEGRDAVVTVAGDSAAVAVAVRDYGIGLAPGEERLVFDRFWRADPARARTSGGTGLGLAIALEDARIHGGWLEAWGEAGRGSVFRLTLPRAIGMELAGSPLPLGPDEAERAEAGTVAAAGEAARAACRPRQAPRAWTMTLRSPDRPRPAGPTGAAPRGPPRRLSRPTARPGRPRIRARSPRRPAPSRPRRAAPTRFRADSRAGHEHVARRTRAHAVAAARPPASPGGPDRRGGRRRGGHRGRMRHRPRQRARAAGGGGPGRRQPGAGLLPADPGGARPGLEPGAHRLRLPRGQRQLRQQPSGGQGVPRPGGQAPLAARLGRHRGQHHTDARPRSSRCPSSSPARPTWSRRSRSPACGWRR